MATVDNRIVSARARAVQIETLMTELSLTSTNTLQEALDGIAATFTSAADCVQCGGTGIIEAVTDTEHYPNETEDSVVDEDGNANPTIICPTCMGDKSTEGQYRAVQPSGVVTYEPIA